MRVPWPAARMMMARLFSVMLRRQDSNLDLTAPKAVVLPLHHGGPCRPRGTPRVNSATPALPGPAQPRNRCRGRHPRETRPREDVSVNITIERIETATPELTAFLRAH